MSTNDVNLSHEQQLSNDTTTCLALASVRTISDLRSCWICCGPFLLQRMGKRTRIQLTQTKKHANNTKKEGPVPLFWAPCVHALETHFVQGRTHIIYFIRETHFCPKSIMIRTFPPLFATDPSTCSFSIFWQPEPGKKRARGDVEKNVGDAAAGGGEEGEIPTSKQGSECIHRCEWSSPLCATHLVWGFIILFVRDFVYLSRALRFICVCVCVRVCVYVFVCVCM